MAKSILFSGTTGGPIKDTDVMAYKEEGVISGDPKRLHLFSAMKEYFQGLLPGKVSDIESSMGSIEYPTVGDPIDPDIDELFFDGVATSGITSDGRVPIIYSSDHEPAIINVEGEEVANPLVKFPNRGVEGFFGQYENEVDDTNFVDVGTPTVAEEDGWIRIQGSGTGTAQRRFIIANTTLGKYISCLVKKGNVSANVTVRVGGDSANVGINFGTEGFNFNNGAVDRGSYFISSTVAKISFYVPTGLSTTYLDLIAENVIDTAATNYSYFKDWMCIEAGNYPVPYVKDIHSITRGEYYFDWFKSNVWTFDMWIKNDGSPASEVASMFLSWGDIQNGGRLYISLGTNKVVLTTYVAGGDFGTAAAGTAVYNEYMHVKFILTDTLSAQISINGAAFDTYSNFSINFADFAKKLYLGTQFDPDSYQYRANGYIADLVIKPYYDDSNTHYTTGLPFINPDTTYGKNGSFSIDKNGGVKTNNLESSGRRVPTISSGDSFPTYNVGLGDECYRTDLDEFYKFNGTVWLQI